MKHYQAVLFDLDGTLLDTSPGILKTIASTIEELDLESITHEERLKFIGPPLMASFMKYCHASEEVALQAIATFRKYYRNGNMLEANVYEGISEVLKALKEKDILIGIATSKKEDFARQLMKHFGLESYFSSIKGAGEKEGLTKADIIKNCIEELDVSYQDTVLIGDTEFDAIGAEQVGIDFIAVTYGFGFKAREDVDCYKNVGTIDLAKELIDIIE